MKRFFTNTIIGGIFFLIPIVVATAILDKAFKMMKSISVFYYQNKRPRVNSV